MPPEEKNNSQEKPNKKRRILLAVIFLLPLLLLVGAVAYYLGSQTLPEEAEGKNIIALKDLKKTTLESFTVNLADAGYARYLRTTITLEYTDKELQEEIELKMHRIKDVVLAVLRDKKVADINSFEKTEQLRQELLDTINIQLTKGKIKGLYFEEFIIQ